MFRARELPSVVTGPPRQTPDLVGQLAAALGSEGLACPYHPPPPRRSLPGSPWADLPVPRLGSATWGRVALRGLGVRGPKGPGQEEKGQQSPGQLS